MPAGATPLVGLNYGKKALMPLLPILADDGGRLVAISPNKIGGEPFVIDLLGEAETETGPAVLSGWLREARSRRAAAPGLIVLPQVLPWRRPYVGAELVWSRGIPRPTPREHEQWSLVEMLTVLVAVSVLCRLIVKED
jgi:hypothetical protein